MARAVALVLAAIIAGAALFVASRMTQTTDDTAREGYLIPAATPEPNVDTLPGPFVPAGPRFSDAEVRALLDRLSTLDAVGALEDDALVRLVEHALEHGA